MHLSQQTAGESEQLRPRLITEKELSAYISVPVSTLQNWRVAGVGLPYVKLGSGRQAPVRYDLADVDRYIDQHKVIPTFAKGNLPLGREPQKRRPPTRVRP